MEGHKSYTGLEYKDWRNPHIRGKFLRIQETDAGEATAVSVGL